jgi:hypothetical protein
LISLACTLLSSLVFVPALLGGGRVTPRTACPVEVARP